MSILSDSKTTNEILMYAHDAAGFIGIVPGQGDKLVEYGNKRWVPVEKAQKLEEENQMMNRDNIAFEKRNIELEDKFIKSNKILDELREAIKSGFWYDVTGPDLAEKYEERLREVLK